MLASALQLATEAEVQMCTDNAFTYLVVVLCTNNYQRQEGDQKEQR